MSGFRRLALIRGRFLSIEGGEGVGKSRLLSGLAEGLRTRGREVLTTREPGGTPAADRIRALFGAPPDADPLLPLTEALLVSAGRAQHVGRLIRPALERGAWVVTDRYHDSMRAYQGILGGVPAAELEQLIAFSTGNLDPDLTFLLDCPVEISMGRLARRSPDEDGVRRFDEARASVHERLRQAFLALQKRHPDRIMVLDATELPERVLERALAQMDSRYPVAGGS